MFTLHTRKGCFLVLKYMASIVDMHIFMGIKKIYLDLFIILCQIFPYHPCVWTYDDCNSIIALTARLLTGLSIWTDLRRTKMNGRMGDQFFLVWVAILTNIRSVLRFIDSNICGSGQLLYLDWLTYQKCSTNWFWSPSALLPTYRRFCV